ncbi:Hypothetical predicted protein [Mytilus galloprovincialis]|nr:Hypothetical predicted protein [Mytilus galloprovincialis]
MQDSLQAILQKDATEWVQETLIESEDSVFQLTKGKFSTKSMRKGVVSQITSTVEDVMEPFDMLNDIAQPFITAYESVFGIVKAVKNAYNALKNSYQFALSAVNKIFGAKAHHQFPRKIRSSGNGCSGEGAYPSKLRAWGQQYWALGIDLEIQNEEVVCITNNY